MSARNKIETTTAAMPTSPTEIPESRGGGAVGSGCDGGGGGDGIGDGGGSPGGGGEGGGSNPEEDDMQNKEVISLRTRVPASRREIERGRLHLAPERFYSSQSPEASGGLPETLRTDGIITNTVHLQTVSHIGSLIPFL